MKDDVESIDGEIVESLPETISSTDRDEAVSHPYSNAPFVQVPINHAQNVHLPSPSIPANDMVLLEKHHQGAIDRILNLSEREQHFNHDMVKLQHNEQVKINDRNIEISKEQKTFNFTKLWMGFFLVLFLMSAGIYLFIHDFKVGGGLILFSGLVLAAVFIIGYFPEGIFSIFKRDKSPNDE